jgi:hypothetical protein
MKNRIFVLLFCVLTFNLNSQVLSVDRENGQDSVPRKYIFTWTCGLSMDKQKRNLIEIQSTEELDIFLKKNRLLILLGNTEIQTNGTTILENNGHFMFRLRDNDTKRVAPDFYAQYQWNGVLGMQNRSLAGINARFKFWEKKQSDLYISSGAFFEYEIWSPSLSSFNFDSTVVNVNRKIIRWNNAVKMALKISDNIDFATNNFVQFPMNDNFKHFLKPRWAMNTSIFFKINKHINFCCNYEHNMDFYRALPIDNYYYSLNFKIQVNY